MRTHPGASTSGYRNVIARQRPGRRARVAAGVLRQIAGCAVAAAALAFPAVASGAPSWKVGTSASPALGTTNELAGASCISTEFCSMVGHFETSSPAETLAEHWNGTKWEFASTPNPSGALGSILTSVSCLSELVGQLFCIAVGYYTGSGGHVPFSEEWNGTKWELQSNQPQNPTGAKESVLLGVSCLKTSSCMAVGDYVEKEDFPLAESWNGTKWTVEKPPSPSEEGLLDGVACPEGCMAVGSYILVGVKGPEELALADWWPRSKWEMTTTANPGEKDLLKGVSCPKGFCRAVGRYVKAGEELTLAEEGGPSGWKQMTTPNPSGTKESRLNGVSCDGPSSCEAVGSSTAFGVESMLAERWGTAWVIQSTPGPSSALATTLNADSCVSSSFCEAGGRWTETGKVFTLIEEFK